MEQETTPAPGNVVRLTTSGKSIILVGTAHVSRDSVEQVRQIISEEKPDRVCVELDERRVTPR